MGAGLGMVGVLFQQVLRNPLAEPTTPDIDVIEQMIFHYSLLPRLAISLLVGAGLGMVGVLFQQVLRNPLAEPTTLGVATGAQLGITVTTLWAIPGAMASQFAALAGACVVGLIVF
ncbi:iron chelate uptake ABC transporter family permease subunit, partial [Pseudomonas aeruginosa]|uniref:iron chelate uptake ABC transporter family permease subunit n=1 Tax=Pseudomonas aeruginosa TaxID=287 RepID=UPI003D18A775